MAVSSTTPNLRHRDHRPLTVVLVGLAIVAVALGGLALRRTTSDDPPARTPAGTAVSTGSPSLRAAGVEDVTAPAATGSPSLRAAGVEDEATP